MAENIIEVTSVKVFLKYMLLLRDQHCLSKTLNMDLKAISGLFPVMDQVKVLYDPGLETRIIRVLHFSSHLPSLVTFRLTILRFSCARWKKHELIVQNDKDRTHSDIYRKTPAVMAIIIRAASGSFYGF